MRRWLLFIWLLLVSCKGDRAGEVVVYTSVDQVTAEPVLKDIERATGLHVRAVYDTEETKSTGVLNRLIAEGDHPQADVFWSGDSVRPALLVQRGLVLPYVSPAAAAIPAAFKAADGSWTGIAARARIPSSLRPTRRARRHLEPAYPDQSEHLRRSASVAAPRKAAPRSRRAFSPGPRPTAGDWPRM